MGIIPAMKTLGERIKKARKGKGWSQTDLGEELGVSRNAVSQWESDDNDPNPERLRLLAVKLDEDYEWLATGRRRHNLVTKGLPLLGEVAAGVWAEVHENQDSAMRRVPVAPHPDYPADAQYALKIKGNSVNKIAPDGTIIVVVDIMKAGLEVRDGDIVCVERKKGHLVETTVKRITKANGALELWPVSDDPAHSKPIRIDAKGDAEVEIKGLVISTVIPVPRGA